MTSRFDPVGLLRVLTEAGVNFVVIGGYAGALLGAPFVTNDLDICYERSAENMDRLAGALRMVGARLRVAHVDEDLPFLLDGKTLAAGDSFTLSTDRGDLDMLATPSGTSGYRDLAAKAIALTVGRDLEVRVVALQDLLRMKRASGRIKDRLHLETLQALSEMDLDGG